MRLISLPVSPFAGRVRIAIRAKGLDVEIVPPPPAWPTHPGFRDLSPAGRVPVLILDDGGTIADSVVILEFLEEAAPERRLLPRAPLDRASVRFLVRHADLALMPPMTALARPKPAGEARRQVEQLVDALEVLERLVDGERYLVGDELTLADCALAPVLFAAQVTGERLGMDLIAGLPRVGAYRDAIAKDESVAVVLDEMRDGLEALVRTT